MATSFIDQVPIVIHVIKTLNPRTILDIGKGFGKYGTLAHEYIGLDSKKAPNPALTIAQQSNIKIDCIDINPEYNFLHLNHFYEEIITGDIIQLYEGLKKYDLVLMADIIEHLPKEQAQALLQKLLQNGMRVLITTPLVFFQQELYESEAERHISHWSKKDLMKITPFLIWQRVGDGGVYLLSPKPTRIRGFGSDFLSKIRRFARNAKDIL